MLSEVEEKNWSGGSVELRGNREDVIRCWSWWQWRVHYINTYMFGV